MRLLRVLNQRGLDEFSAFLQSGAGATTLPSHLLDDEEFSEVFEISVRVPEEQFRTKLALARALDAAITDAARPRLSQNAGAWSWLALLYLEQLAPRRNGQRQFGAAYRYILSGDYRHVHRHLVAGPYYIFQNHREHSRVLLAPEVHKHGDFAEQLGSRQEFITNRAVIATVDLLYCDSESGRPKRGATNRKRAGTLRRFVTVLQQLERTYDLYGMDQAELVSLLPSEFRSWHAGRA